jgi:hypothetical protein
MSTIRGVVVPRGTDGYRQAMSAAAAAGDAGGRRPAIDPAGHSLRAVRSIGTRYPPAPAAAMAEAEAATTRPGERGGQERATAGGAA